MEIDYLVGLVLLCGSFVFFVKWLNQRKKLPVAEKVSKKVLLKEIEMAFSPENNKNRKGELERVKNEYFSKKEKIKQLHDALVSSIKENPELAGFIPSDTFIYEGYWKELGKRFQTNQIRKTAKVTAEKIKEIKKVWEEWASLYKSIADFEKSFFELAMLEKEFLLKDKRSKITLNRIDLEEEVERLKLEKEKAKLEKEIEDIKSVKINSSFEDKFLQKTENLIRELTAKGAGFKMFLEAKNKMLSDPSIQKDSKIYYKIKNMWENAIFDLFEK